MNKKRTAKAVLAAFGLSIALPTAALAATDINGHWAEGVLLKWEQKGLMAGYEDNTIRPDAPITRAELVSLINRVAGFDVAAAIGFTDVSADDWYATQVAIGVNASYVGGYPDNTFRPNQYVTRAEAASMVARLYKLADNSERAAQFADAAKLPEWALGVIGAVADAGYMVGDTNNNFNATTYMTRAEAAAALDRVFNVSDESSESGEKTLTASLSATNGTITKGSTKTITVSTIAGATVRAISTNESVATVVVNGNTITITGVANGNATIAITVSAPGYADAKLVYSAHVATATTGGGGGGSSISNSVTVYTKDADITLPSGYDYEDVSIKTVVYKNTAVGEEDATTYATLPSTLEVSGVTLPAGSQIAATVGDKTYHMTLVNDIYRDDTTSIKVGDIMDAIEAGSDAYVALDSLNEERPLIECKPDGNTLHWFIDGMVWNELEDVFGVLEVTIVEK